MFFFLFFLSGSFSSLSPLMMEVPKFLFVFILFLLCITYVFHWAIMNSKLISITVSLPPFLFHNSSYNWTYISGWHTKILYLIYMGEKVIIFFSIWQLPFNFPIIINCIMISPNSQDWNITFDFFSSSNFSAAKSCKSHGFISTMSLFFLSSVSFTYLSL